MSGVRFESRQAFRKWLSENVEGEGVWVDFLKEGPKDRLKPDEALEEALCFGWIDGLIKKVDDVSYLKYFAPRRKGSKWSEKNKKLTEKLIAEGLMTQSGLNAIERAKKDGEWDAPANPLTDEDFERFFSAIAHNRQASENFNGMPKSVQKQFVGLYRDAKKEETRIKRLEKLIGLLKQNKRPMG